MLIRVLRMKLIKVLAAGWLSSSSECSPSNTLCFLSLFFLPSENCKKKSSAALSLSLTPSKLLAHLPRASFVLLCRCWTVNQTGECISLCSQCNFGERTFRVSLEKKEKSKFTSMASTVVLYCALKQHHLLQQFKQDLVSSQSNTRSVSLAGISVLRN